ncbi:DUF3570 domain-containing protein [Halobacteriovorax sp.]|uniref:DUF3570 domain-containing protein n=1 Tax=Halobacteriovorax sp. TaxID=2020862 RepID=UPI00356A3E96
MAVIRWSLLTTFILALSIVQSFAEMLTPKIWKTKILFNIYSQSSNNGAQVYDDSGDEDAFVFEPMFFASYQIDETTNISAHMTIDTWTAESDTRLDANTGQSGEGIEGQGRISGNFSYSKEVGKSLWTPKIGFSSEYDYKSLNAGLSWTGSFAEDNFTLTSSAQFFMDSTNLFDYVNEKTTESKDKRVYSLDINASQFLTKNDILSFGQTTIIQNGALESIRNSTNVGGTRVAEQLPGSRKRYAYYIQHVHAFSDDLAFSNKYRFYHDSWDLKSHTIETSLRFTTNNENGFLELNYRLYSQNSVEYFHRTLPSLLPSFTNDSDLEKFTSHRVGPHYSYDLGETKVFNFEIENLNLSTAAYYYTRSNDLSYVLTQFSIGAEF